METILPAAHIAPPNAAHKIAFIGAAALCLLPMATPPLALAGGLAFALTVGNPFPDATRRLSKTLLQACVVLLGFGMNLGAALHAGAHGAILAAVTIGVTFALGRWLGRRLNVAPVASLLISAGTAICGGSAIAAVGATIGAAEADMAVSLGTVFVLNAVALFVFPVIGHALHLSPAQFGTWAGVAIHDISSVVGAASGYGPGALTTATATKLSRALWIVPVTAIIGWKARQKAASATEGSAVKASAPWFVGGFLLTAGLRQWVPGVAAHAPWLTHLATVGLTLTLFLVGASLSRALVRAVGWKPMAQGVALWVAISVTALVAVLHGA